MCLPSYLVLKGMDVRLLGDTGHALTATDIDFTRHMFTMGLDLLPLTVKSPVSLSFVEEVKEW